MLKNRQELLSGMIRFQAFILAIFGKLLAAYRIHLGGDMKLNKQNTRAFFFTLLLTLATPLSHADSVTGDIKFISDINAELITKQCQEDFSAAEMEYKELKQTDESLVQGAKQHQEIIDQIIARAQTLVEDHGSPYGKFVEDYFSGNAKALGMANIRIAKEPRVNLDVGDSVESYLRGAGFALGSESTSSRLSFRFRYQGTCISSQLNDCRTTPRESIVNVRVLKEKSGNIIYTYELDKHAEPIKSDSQSILSRIGFYGSQSAIKARVANVNAIEEFIMAHGQDFDSFMQAKVGKACFELVTGVKPHEAAPHEMKPHEFKPHEAKPHEEGAAALFSGLSRRSLINRAPAAGLGSEILQGAGSKDSE